MRQRENGLVAKAGVLDPGAVRIVLLGVLCCAALTTPAVADVDVLPVDDALVVSCRGDGTATISGTVTLRNDGSDSVTADIPMHFTLYDNTGCAGSLLTDWTETFSGVNIPAGNTQIFTVTQLHFSLNLCTTATRCEVSLNVEVDYSDTIAESDEGNNTTCTGAKDVQIPDPGVNSISSSVTCTGDGSCQGEVTVNVGNDGCAAANNVGVSLVSDCGLTFVDQAVTLTAETTQNLTFTFSPSTGWCSCTYTATVDPDYTMCECDGTNNTLSSAPFTSPLSDLVVTDLDFTNISCSGDGVSGSVVIAVANQGCGAANNFTVALTTDGCLSFSDELIGSLAAANSTTVAFPITGAWLDCTDGECEFTATADPSDTVAEFDGTNNTRVEIYTSTLPDLEVASDELVVDAATAGQVTVSGALTLANVGCGQRLTADVSVRYTVYDGLGGIGDHLDQWTETLSPVDIAAGGGQQAFTIVPHSIATAACDGTGGCDLSIVVELDPADSLCECAAANNLYIVDRQIAAPAIPTLSASGVLLLLLGVATTAVLVTRRISRP